jgi:hypothetical protein
MFKISAASVITELVDALLPRAPETGLGIQIIAELNGNPDFGEGDKSIRQHISFVFHRPSNYTKVFFHVGDQALPFHAIPAWSLMSNHDSCWREDGVSSNLAKVYFAMAKNFSGAPIKQIDTTRLASFSPKILKVQVERTGKEDPREAYSLAIIH